MTLSLCHLYILAMLLLLLSLVLFCGAAGQRMWDARLRERELKYIVDCSLVVDRRGTKYIIHTHCPIRDAPFLLHDVP